MKALYFLSTVVMVTVLATGCKKGEEDPFLSIWSRDARLCNDWKLKSVTGTTNTTTTAGSTSLLDNYAYSYDGSSFEISNTYTEPFSGDVVTEKEGKLNYVFEMTIEKEGLCNVLETYSDSGVGSPVSNTLTGTWQWTSDDQAKTGISMDILANTLLTQTDWVIKELKNKEMKWIYQATLVLSDGSSSTTTTYDWEVVFEKK